jgi:carboxyl-terminal processing protease
MSWNRETCVIVIALLVVASSALGQLPKADPQSFKPIELFEEVWQLCTNYFYSPTQAPPDWKALQAKYQPMFEKTESLEEGSAAVNLMLNELKTSHTHLYTRADWEYYDLLDIFRAAFEDRIKEFFPDGKITYRNIGVFTQTIHGKTFVKSVLDGGPAFKAGIMAGDEIRSVDGKEYEPVKSFVKKTRVIARIQQSADPHSVKDIKVVPEDNSAAERYMAAMEASIRTITNSGFGIGYIHIWSFTGEQYYLQLLKEIQSGRIKDADALVLDLRDGWGGANPYYLSPFDPAIPTEIPSNNGRNKTIDFKWKKPVILLVNEGTRSGKETLAYGFKHLKLGKVVGTTTAGANVGGAVFLLKGGCLLELSVKPRQAPAVPAPLGLSPESTQSPFLFLMQHPEATEGKGVEPDITVQFPLEYAQGKDPQLKAAVQAAVESIRSSSITR